MSSAVSLRPARPGDLEAICALLSTLGLPTAGVAEWWQQFTVGESPQGIVGAAGVEIYEDGALLRSVAVSVRGTGLGRRLVETALETARSAGAKDVYLLTTTADRYFPRLGFATVSRDSIPESVQTSVEFRGACPASAVAMHRSLVDA